MKRHLKLSILILSLIIIISCVCFVACNDPTPQPTPPVTQNPISLNGYFSAIEKGVNLKYSNIAGDNTFEAQNVFEVNATSYYNGKQEKEITHNFGEDIANQLDKYVNALYDKVCIEEGKVKLLTDLHTSEYEVNEPYCFDKPIYLFNSDNYKVVIEPKAHNNYTTVLVKIIAKFDIKNDDVITCEVSQQFYSYGTGYSKMAITPILRVGYSMKMEFLPKQSKIVEVNSNDTDKMYLQIDIQSIDVYYENGNKLDIENDKYVIDFSKGTGKTYEPIILVNRSDVNYVGSVQLHEYFNENDNIVLNAGESRLVKYIAQETDSYIIQAPGLIITKIRVHKGDKFVGPSNSSDLDDSLQATQLERVLQSGKEYFIYLSNVSNETVKTALNVEKNTQELTYGKECDIFIKDKVSGGSMFKFVAAQTGPLDYHINVDDAYLMFLCDDTGEPVYYDGTISKDSFICGLENGKTYYIYLVRYDNYNSIHTTATIEQREHAHFAWKIFDGDNEVKIDYDQYNAYYSCELSRGKSYRIELWNNSQQVNSSIFFNKDYYDTVDFDMETSTLTIGEDTIYYDRINLSVSGGWSEEWNTDTIYIFDDLGIRVVLGDDDLYMTQDNVNDDVKISFDKGHNITTVYYTVTGTNVNGRNFSYRLKTEEDTLSLLDDLKSVNAVGVITIVVDCVDVKTSDVSTMIEVDLTKPKTLTIDLSQIENYPYK